MTTQDAFERIGRYRVFRRIWLPDTKPRARVVLVHGLAEHTGRYDPVAEFFAAHGCEVYGFDLPGHGRSSGRRVCIRRFSEFIEVLDSCVRWVNRPSPALPLFLYAHSVGALVATTWLASSSIRPCGAVLSGPCVRIPQHVTPRTRALAMALSRILPWCGVSAVDAKGVSRDPLQVRKYVEDPLVVHKKTTARLAGELMTAIRRLTVTAPLITIPCLILQGGNDTIVDPDSARWLYNAVGSDDKHLEVFAGLHHEVHNEPEREAVLDHALRWMMLRTPPSSADGQ